MNSKLLQRIVAVMCCLMFVSCTTSRVVTESREEVIPEATATRMRPILKVIQYPQDDPRLILQLSKQLEGPITLQERKYEVIHPVWGNSIGNVLLGWPVLLLSPVAVIGNALSGKFDGEWAINIIKDSFLGATGFNAPNPKSSFHLKDRKGVVKTESTSMGSGVREVPWDSGEISMVRDEQVRVRLPTDLNGKVIVDVTKLPIGGEAGSGNVTLTFLGEAGGARAEEHVTVPISKVLAWKEREAALVKKAQQQEEQARRERQAQIEYDTNHPEEVAFRRLSQANGVAADKLNSCRSQCQRDADRNTFIGGLITVEDYERKNRCNNECREDFRRAMDRAKKRAAEEGLRDIPDW